MSAAKNLTLNTQEANEEAAARGDSLNFSDGGEYSITPTELMDPIFENRRPSATSILSADVLDSVRGEPDFLEANDRFYLLKKDSQRRLTLVHVLQKDKALIIDSWLRLIGDQPQRKFPITKVSTDAHNIIHLPYSINM